MKKVNKIGYLLAQVVLLIVCESNAYSQSNIINDVKNAIKIGASKEITHLLHENVYLTINGDMDRYSQSQAEYILKEFFTKHPPSSFVIVHQGASRSGAPYATGQYTSENDTFLVWLRIKEESGRLLIHEMSFIEE